MRMLPPRGRRRAARDPRRAAPPAAPPAPTPPVTLLVRPEVLRSLAASVATAGDVETGGPLIGTVQRSWEPAGERLIVCVLATVAPSARDGRVASVSVGRGGEGERAASAVRWWRSASGLDLVHLGDWHRHVWGSPEPSGGDRATAKRLGAQSPAPVWLTAVATGRRRRRHQVEEKGEEVRFIDAAAVTGVVRFFREAGGAGLVAVRARVEGAALPALPALPWYVADPARFAAECRLLRAAGYRAALQPASSDDGHGAVLRLRREGAPDVTVITGPRYPRQAPVRLDARGRRVPPAGAWSPHRYLVDLVDLVGEGKR